MDSKADINETAGRRGFLKRAGLGLSGGLLATSALSAQSSETSAQAPETKPETVSHSGVTRPLTDVEKTARIASNSYPIRFNFKMRGRGENSQKSQEMQK